MNPSSQAARAKLKEFQSQIAPIVDEIFKQDLSQVESTYNKHSRKLLETVQEITCRDAKRLRASFVYFVYKMYGGKNLQEALKAAIAIEIIHAYLLIEDDFMDLSATRRGGPTAHVIFTDYHKENFEKGNVEHFGHSIAVDSGLLGCHFAMNLLNSLNFPAETLIKANRNLNEKLMTTAYGQANDVINECTFNLNEDDIFNVLHWKTSAYTYENPMHLGAILAGANEEELKRLSEYAIPGGLAFQIQDDILGMFGEEDRMGKSNMDDLREGKMTLLIYKALQNGDQVQKNIVKNALGNPDLTREMHSDVQQVLIDTGALEYSTSKAQEYTKIAKDSLTVNKNPLWSEEEVNYLLGIADYVVERRK